MSREKVKLAFIANDSARRTSYRKRKKSLLKKTEELSTLCGIEACAIVYSPYDPEPQIWPSESGVQNVLRKFRTLPEWEQSKMMANQESFIAQSIQKCKEKMKKLEKDNKEKEMTMFMFQCLNEGRVLLDNNMMAADLNDLSSIIEQNLKDISRRLERLNVDEMTPYQPQMQTLVYQPRIQMQIPAYQPQMQTPAYQPQMQTAAYQPQMQTPAYQPQMQTAAPEEMTLLNYGHVSDMTVNPMQSQWFMDLVNGNGDETIMPSFGDANLQL